VSLPSGARLGPYEIQSAIGAGGMGEVYKARDTRLDRTVAIKILPEALAADSQFRDRFDREARAISQLDHPHICALYDVGEQHGTAYLVMQYLEGETLADRLTRGALPLELALQVAVQITNALVTAHKAGIVHRDLKPANIMLTKSGAKLLDFGVAKLRGPAAPISMSGMTRLATAAPGTAQGTILGTVQYMAPEQVEGHEADARSDIWALGAVLYEMATGQRPFDGHSPASVIGAILKDTPTPISTRQPLVPAMLDHVVETCLAKVRTSGGRPPSMLDVNCAGSRRIGLRSPRHQFHPAAPGETVRRGGCRARCWRRSCSCSCGAGQRRRQAILCVCRSTRPNVPCFPAA
jgi:serine/threonine-protein kinase